MRDQSKSMKNVLADRYGSDEMKSIWSPEAKILAERRLWIEIMKSQAALGIDIPAAAIEKYESVSKVINLESIDAREKTLRHDVKARIEEFNALAGFEFIHLGLTSRDLTENIEIVQIRDSLHLIRREVLALLEKLNKKSLQYADLAIVGRSHNIPAQITTLGKRFASASEELLFAFARLESIIDRLPLRGIRGPVGTAQDGIDYLETAQRHQQLEGALAVGLGFDQILDSTGQIYPRSIDFEVVSTLVQVASGPSSLATSIRLMAGAELIAEGFKAGQVGSSAMPHKMNTRSSERVNGLSVVLRGYLSMVSELAGDQWNEGDVACSVVRRVALSDSFFALDGLLQTSIVILDELVIFEGAIDREISRQLPFLASTRILTEAVKKGMGREGAHKIIKEYAVKAVDEMRRSGDHQFIKELGADQEFLLSEEDLNKILGDRASFFGGAKDQVVKVSERINKTLTKYSELKPFTPNTIR